MDTGLGLDEKNMQMGQCWEGAQKASAEATADQPWQSGPGGHLVQPLHFINGETEVREGPGWLEATRPRQPQLSSHTPSQDGGLEQNCSLRGSWNCKRALESQNSVYKSRREDLSILKVLRLNWPNVGTVESQNRFNFETTGRILNSQTTEP